MVDSISGEIVDTLDELEFYRMPFDIVMVYAHSKDRQELCFVIKASVSGSGENAIESAIMRYSYFREECSRLERTAVPQNILEALESEIPEP